MGCPNRMSAQENFGCGMSGYNVGVGEILDVRCPGRMSAEENSRCEMSRWNVGGEEFRM